MKVNFELFRKTCGKKCPCKIVPDNDEDVICPCKEFLETGKCLCGIFYEDEVK